MPLVAWGVQVLGRFRIAAELALLVVILDGLRRALDPHLTDGRPGGGGRPAGRRCALCRVRLRRGDNRRSLPSPPWPPRGCSRSRASRSSGRTTDTRYQGKDPAFDWVERNAPSGAKIGLAGTNAFDGVAPGYPMFGPDLENRVVYVGPFVKGGLRHYRTRAALREGPAERVTTTCWWSDARRSSTSGGPGQRSGRAAPASRWSPAAGNLTLMRAPQ